MVRRTDVREGSRIVVVATGSGEEKVGTVVKCYPNYAVVDYKIHDKPLYDEGVTTLRESYLYGDIKKVLS